MTFHLHTANRLERLADALAEALHAAPADPFAETRVTVAQPGMARWLEIRLARILGVVMRFDWPLPARTAWQLLQAAGTGLPAEDPLERPRLALRIWQGLRQGRLRVPAALRPGDDEEGLRSWRIADSLAEAFDQYPLYRPDWVRDWDAGRPGFGGDPALIDRFGWQGTLWRQLTQGTAHRQQLVDRLRQRLHAGERPPGLPRRLFLFGLSHLPPLYLDLFLDLALASEVHAFVLTPSAEWWGDAPNRRAARERLLADEDVIHPLLALWGREARDFIDLLYERLERVPHETHEHFAPAVTDTSLHRIQAHLQNLEDTGPSTPDASLRIHATHNPMRACQETVEAILAARRADPGLAPREIAILCTDIDRYAPFLAAAFEALPPAARLPYAIVDRSATAGHSLLENLLAMLQLPGIRVTAAWIRALLDEPAFRRRFNIDEALLPDLTAWLQDQGVRWGLTAEDRQQQGFAGADHHSLAFGERRALAGYALADDAYRLFQDIAPADDVEGELAEALGGLMLLGERLRHWRRRLGGGRPLSHWCRELAALVPEFTAPRGEELDQLAPLHEALAALEEDVRVLGLDPVIGPALFRALLTARLTPPRLTEGYLAGSITCCALQPLRNLPFRHIHVLGLNEADFPRPDRRSALNALTLNGRRGDRSPRDDDRLMLLETLLAARDALHLHFQDRDPRDDSARQPAVPLVELLEYLDPATPAEASLQRPAGGSGRNGFLVFHPMQPFSPRRYEGAQAACHPFWFETARAVQDSRVRQQPIALGDVPAPLPEGLDPTLDLDDLGRFLSAPLGWFFTRGLGLPRPEELPTLEEDERFHLNKLDGYRVCERLWLAFAEEAGVPKQVIAERLHAEGLLPEGPAGEAAWQAQAGQWQRLHKRLVNYWGERLDPVPLHLPFEYEGRDFALEGWLRNLHRKEGELRLLRVRLGNRRPKDWMGLWVEMLAACAAEQPIVEARTLARDGDLAFRPLPPEAARGQLATLARLALEGLTRPIPFAPEAVVLWLEEPDPERRAARISREWKEETWKETRHLVRIWGEIASPLEIEGFTDRVQSLADLAGRVGTP